jgi:hypothetical protein
MGHERGICSRAPFANLGVIAGSRYSVIRPVELDSDGGPAARRPGGIVMMSRR